MENTATDLFGLDPEKVSSVLEITHRNELFTWDENPDKTVNLHFGSEWDCKVFVAAYEFIFKSDKIA